MVVILIVFENQICLFFLETNVNKLPASFIIPSVVRTTNDLFESHDFTGKSESKTKYNKKSWF